jgi:putative transposase
MISDSDRRRAVELIDEARASGARLKPACDVIKISVRTYERWTETGTVKVDGRPLATRPKPVNSLSDEERAAIIETVNLPKYASAPPSQIVPDLADNGVYIGSESTFYRILHNNNLQKHRGRSRESTAQYQPTTYVASAPNQVWTWDITWLPGPIRGYFFKLYLIIDIFSRYIVGWEIWEEETEAHASELIRATILKENLQGELSVRKEKNLPLVLHQDNGPPMKGATFQATLISLGIERSYSRPRVSNDNPFSESGFKTLKYRPNYKVKGFKDT